MVEIIKTDTGFSILLKVKPNAKRNSIVGCHGNRLKVSVTAPPEDGKANKAVIKLIAKKVDIKPAQVEIISGCASRGKKLHVTGVTLQSLEKLCIEV